MARRVMLEVTQPFHKSGTEVMFQPGELFPPDAELPDGVSVREVVAEVPDEPAPAPEPAKAPARTPAKGAAS